MIEGLLKTVKVLILYENFSDKDIVEYEEDCEYYSNLDPDYEPDINKLSREIVIAIRETEIILTQKRKNCDLVHPYLKEQENTKRSPRHTKYT